LLRWNNSFRHTGRQGPPPCQNGDGGISRGTRNRPRLRYRQLLYQDSFLLKKIRNTEPYTFFLLLQVKS